MAESILINTQLIASSEDAGERFDRFVAMRVPELSRARIQDLMKEGRILLNGKSVKPKTDIKSGDVVTVEEPPAVPSETLAEEIPLDILYEDDDLIVIHKPAGLVVHPAAGNWTGTIVNALLHHCQSLSGIGGEQRPGIVHRLDKETSGCLVAAKSDLAHRALVRQFAGREISKVYLALASGAFRSASGMVDLPIGRHPVNRKKMAVLEDGKGRSAKTGWRVLKEFAFGNRKPASLVECTLYTGRTHQIRVHLKHLGHPILGDEVYGERAGFTRQMLHAWRLGFQHPRTGEMLHFRAPLPPDFRNIGLTEAECASPAPL